MGAGSGKAGAGRAGRCRTLAERGEFTKREFLNGRIDLAQAEASLIVITRAPNSPRAANEPGSLQYCETQSTNCAMTYVTARARGGEY